MTQMFSFALKATLETARDKETFFKPYKTQSILNAKCIVRIFKSFLGHIL